MLPFYHTRQPWESLCSSHALEYPSPTDLLAFVEPEYEPMDVTYVHEQKIEGHRFFVGGFEIVVYRPYRNNGYTYSTEENTVTITKISTEKGTGNSVVVANGKSCIIKNCNTVHVHKRYVNVTLDCEKCLGVQVTNATRCESSNATHMTIEKCPDVQEIHGWYADIDTTIKPGCNEPVLFAAKPTTPLRKVEKMNFAGLYLEYNHFTQELDVSSDMIVKVFNVDMVRIEDIPMCEVRHCNVVKGTPITYSGLQNWSDRMVNCQKVFFRQHHV
jgi:hypothetical protein